MRIIINEKYDIDEFNEGVTLDEAIDGIAYKADISLIETRALADLKIKKGDRIQIFDIEFHTTNEVNIFKGVVWETKRSEKSKKLTLSCKERTVYLEESEDEYQFNENTATQRLKQYCKDWNIPVGNIADTKVKLAKTVYKSSKILDMMKKDLKETVTKGGELYKIRMGNSLELSLLGVNKKIWNLDTIVEDIDKTDSLSGAITSVKVLGKSKDDKSKSPVIGTYKKDVDKYGTLQKIKQDEKITNAKEAKSAANNMFNTGEETISVKAVKDINTLRAGDKVSLKGQELFVIDVKHDIKNAPKMDLSLGTIPYIRRKFYSE